MGGELRGFVAARHRQHGFLLLQASKRKKGIHYQLPGGRVDESEVTAHGLEEGCRVAAARELFEETGIDVRSQLDRLRPLELCASPHEGLEKFHGRMYFELEISEADSSSADGSLPPLTSEDFRLLLSSEHRAWIFEKDLEKAALAVEHHSGGYNSAALRAGVRPWS
jgi:8-oxo-dGTP pyrophosphatase MutT (NUDIX family)